jgi:hypothetical protein
VFLAVKIKIMKYFMTPWSFIWNYPHFSLHLQDRRWRQQAGLKFWCSTAWLRGVTT